MDCEKFESTLLDELYDELDEVTSAAAKRHVGGCSRCAALLSGMKATRRLAVLPLVEPPADLEDRILAAAREAQKVVPLTRQASRAISRAGSWAMRPQTGMAAVFLLGIGLSALLLKGKHAAPPSTMTVSEQGEPVPSATTVTLARPAGRARTRRRRPARSAAALPARAAGGGDGAGVRRAARRGTRRTGTWRRGKVAQRAAGAGGRPQRRREVGGERRWRRRRATSCSRISVGARAATRRRTRRRWRERPRSTGGRDPAGEPPCGRSPARGAPRRRISRWTRRQRRPANAQAQSAPPTLRQRDGRSYRRGRLRDGDDALRWARVGGRSHLRALGRAERERRSGVRERGAALRPGGADRAAPATTARSTTRRSRGRSATASSGRLDAAQARFQLAPHGAWVRGPREDRARRDGAEGRCESRRRSRRPRRRAPAPATRQCY